MDLDPRIRFERWPGNVSLESENGSKKQLVVVGHGMVGHRFCERLAERGAIERFELSVFCEEPRPAYDRVKLTSYLSGTSASELGLADPDWYRANEIRLLVGEQATAIDRQARVVVSARGARFPYDVLVLATGSRPFVPKIDGIAKPGVFVYRTIEDLDRIAACAKSVSAAAVLGGGLLGLEAAKAVLDLGLSVHILEAAPRLMPRQLDATAAALLARKVEALGVRVHVGKSIVRVLGEDSVAGVELSDGSELDVGLLVVSAGIVPRDELARAAGLEVAERGGVVVDDSLRTSDPEIFAIGEVALHGGRVYGLVGPGYEMADALARQLAGEQAAFGGADMSTRLKLLGVDVASFGDPFADENSGRHVRFEDHVRGVYQKLCLDEEGTRLLGGVLVGDTSAFAELYDRTRRGAALEMPAHELLVGKSASASAAALADSALVCSCNGVTKGGIDDAIRDGGACTLPAIKCATKAGTGCGGCLSLVSQILDAALAAQGKKVRPRLCEHFDYTRQELFQIVKIHRIRSFEALLESHGSGIGCEICKPGVASILASLFNEPILSHESLQDTNDRFLANVQRRGLYSIVPRVPGGEITPEKLIVLGRVAKKYGLYTKITGGQRIDLLGARLEQLPDIWEELVDAGFESGHAYGKAVRTVKSCVGTSWCRYGVQDSVAFAIRIENRYKGIRAPHKLKSAVSGCARECAEAQSKDFGMIATERGYNVYVCGNGGMKPRHADLLASDLDEATVIRYLDRFIMYYVSTADRLTRTSVWLEKMDGGIEYLRQVIIEDRLGICDELERQMKSLVDTYQCEWALVVNDPKLRARFRHFANSDGGDDAIELVPERGQLRPADWPATKAAKPARDDVVRLPLVAENEAARRWVRVASEADVPRDGGISVRYGRAQIAIFHFASQDRWYACQNRCPHMGDMVLARGIIGDHGGVPMVACPLHKKTFSLESGECLSGEPFEIVTFPIRVADGSVYLKLPPESALDALGPRENARCSLRGGLGTSLSADPRKEAIR